MSEDKTSYYLLTKEHVSVENFDGKEILKVSNEGLTLLAQTAFRTCSSFCGPITRSKWLRFYRSRGERQR